MQNPISKRMLALALVPTALILAPFATAENAHVQAGGQKVAAQKVVAKPAPVAPVGSKAQRDTAHQCFLSQLDLSKEQSDKVKTIMDEAHKQGESLKSQLHNKRQSLMLYLQNSDASLPQALNLNTDINSLQRQLGELRLKTIFAIRAQLNPEQMKKLQHLQKERMARHKASSCWQHDEFPGKRPSESGAASKPGSTPGKTAKP